MDDYSKTPKQQVFFPSKKEAVNGNVELLNKKAAKQKKVLIEAAENEQKARAEYNKSIQNYSTGYKNFIPTNNNILIRMFLKPISMVGKNLVIDTSVLDKIPIKTRNGQGILKHVVNPFPFTTHAIVVSVNKYEEEIKPGDHVSVGLIIPQCPVPGDENIMDYPYFFALPDYVYPTPARNYDDEHFGYLLMPRSNIKGIVKTNN